MMSAVKGRFQVSALAFMSLTSGVFEKETVYEQPRPGQ
jgi:hypothetical protein